MENENIVRIELGRIEPSPGNRKVGGFDAAKLEQLADSIKAVGVQQPAIIRPKVVPGGLLLYELVAGERRWRASKLAGVPDLPCVIRELDDIAVLKIQTIENLQREDVHPLDEADGYQRLIETAGYQIEQVAAELGKSISYVYQRLKLRDLIPDARKLFVDGKITAGHAILIARLVKDDQQQALHYIRNHDLDNPPSVRDLANWIQRCLFLDLSSAVWKHDDAELLPEAGACKTCMKRPGAQPELFADVCKEIKRDNCLDRKCFEKKTEAILKRNREELKDTKHLEVMGGWTDNREKTPAGALDHYDWHECKKNDKGALPALIVGGEGKGRVTWGKKGQESSSRSTYREPAEEKAKREAEERREKAEEEKQKLVRRRIYDAVSKVVKEKRIGSLLQQKLLDGIFTFILDRVCRKYGYQLDGMIEAEGWGTKGNGYTSREVIVLKKINGLDAHQLLIMLLKITMSEFLDHQRYRRENLKPVEVLADSLGVDVKTITAAVTAELKARPALAGKDSPGGPSPKRKRGGS